MASCFPSLLLELECLFYRRSRSYLLVPRMARWILFLPIPSFIHGQRSRNTKPWDKHQVRVTDLVANQVFIPCLLQMAIDDSSYTLDLVAITVFRRFDLLVLVELFRYG